jgi:hypothetical protein
MEIAMESGRTLISRDDMERLIMARVDLEKCENETIPALHRRVAQARQALQQYGCHKSFCAVTLQSEARCTCGLEAAIEDNSR